jgi:hypothetical protein
MARFEAVRALWPGALATGFAVTKVIPLKQARNNNPKKFYRTTCDSWFLI